MSIYSRFVKLWKFFTPLFYVTAFSASLTCGIYYEWPVFVILVLSFALGFEVNNLVKY